MPIAHAMKFLDDLEDLESLRLELYGIMGREDLFSRLARAGYRFDGGQFEEAVDHLHVQCQTAEEADHLLQKATWFRMVCANA